MSQTLFQVSSIALLAYKINKISLKNKNSRQNRLPFPPPVNPDHHPI
jgi:hypothetical protein